MSKTKYFCSYHTIQPCSDPPEPPAKSLTTVHFLIPMALCLPNLPQLHQLTVNSAYSPQSHLFFRFPDFFSVNTNSPPSMSNMTTSHHVTCLSVYCDSQMLTNSVLVLLPETLKKTQTQRQSFLRVFSASSLTRSYSSLLIITLSSLTFSELLSLAFLCFRLLSIPTPFDIAQNLLIFQRRTQLLLIPYPLILLSTVSPNELS